MNTRTTANKDYYATLGVTPEAGSDEIRKAYRRLAFEWHPDRNPHNPLATERFQEISEAYAVLIDADKRRQYDSLRSAGRASNIPFSRDDLFRDMFTNPFSNSIFEELAREFERAGMRVDRTYFQNTLFGGRAFIMGGVFFISPLAPLIGLFRLARTAMGSARTDSIQGKQSGALAAPISTLAGMMKMGRKLLGLPAMLISSAVRPGPGDLTLPIDLAISEAAQGTLKDIFIDAGIGPERLQVRIPPGVKDGNRLRLKGRGRPGSFGSRGDIYLQVRISQPVQPTR